MLVVEDDVHLRDLVVLHLQLEGLTAMAAGTGAEGLRLAKADPFDLLILDVMLPELDGVTVCRAVRRESMNGDVPILMLTARREEADKVLGLESGADDYLTKPFGIREFVARVRALLRPAPVASVGEAAAAAHAGPLIVDPARRHARINDREIELTAHEFDLLYLLASNRGIVFSREALMQKVWGDDTHITERSVDTLVKRVRAKDRRRSGRAAVRAHGLGHRLQVRRRVLMSDPVWYRSLYWRIAFGFIALLAILLLAQGVLFLWLTDRFVGSSARTPTQLAALVAAEVSPNSHAASGRSTRRSSSATRFSHIYQPFLVVLRDGRARIQPAERRCPPELARGRFEAAHAAPAACRRGAFGRPRRAAVPGFPHRVRRRSSSAGAGRDSSPCPATRRPFRSRSRSSAQH